MPAGTARHRRDVSAAARDSYHVVLMSGRPDRLLADKAYSSRGIRSYLRRRAIQAVIPDRPTGSAPPAPR